MAEPSDEIALEPLEKASRFFELLKASGVPDVELLDHAALQFVGWHKVAINTFISPTSILAGGVGDREMSTDPHLYHHILGVMREVLHAAPVVLGQSLLRNLATPGQILVSTKRDSSSHKPSMCVDWEKGNKMELQVILRNPIRRAKGKALEMPRLQGMYALLKKAQQVREPVAKGCSKL